MRRVILDTDLAMGPYRSDIDDGFALALALAEPDIRLEAVTTVNGNIDARSATLLSVELLRRLGASDVPVYEGAASPLIRPDEGHVPATEVHDAFGGHRWESPPAAVELVRRVMAEPGEITIVAIGPLTNIALAAALEPRFVGAVRELIVMGGAFRHTVDPPDIPGEWNIYVDPEAAAAVLAAGFRPRLVGLDVTMRIRLTAGDAVRMGELDTPFATFAAEACLRWMNVDVTRPAEEWEHRSCVLHDPLALAAAVRPDFLTWEPAHVRVSLDELTRGMTLADFRVDGPRIPNAEIASAVDADGFRDYLMERITRA